MRRRSSAAFDRLLGAFGREEDGDCDGDGTEENEGVGSDLLGPVEGDAAVGIDLSLDVLNR